jgi:hypothetical protein
MPKIGSPNFQRHIVDSFWALLYAVASLALCFFALHYLNPRLTSRPFSR